MEQQRNLNHLFSGYYDGLAIFFGGDAVASVLKKRFNIYWNEKGNLITKEGNFEKAVKWMEKKSKQISRCEVGTTGYWVEPKCR